jgi:type IV pilus assembly protein PilW
MNTMNYRKPAVPQSGNRFAQFGFSLIELMLAMTVTLFIIGALITVVLGSAATGRSRDQASDLQTNGRYALQQMKADLLHAGFLGISSLFTPDQAISADGIVVTDACDAAATGRLSQRLWGSNDANPFAATCIPAANYLAGDVLVIRSLNPTPVVAPFAATQVYYHSSYEGGQPFVGPLPPDFTGSNKQPPYLDYEVQETVYYVSPYTTSPAEVPLVPALYRTRLGVGPAMIPELVASGVENMQVRYGVFQTNSTVQYFSANEIPAAAWDLVKSLEVFLLLSSPTPDAGYQNNNTYAMGGQNVVVNDGLRRLLLSGVTELRN